MSAEQIVALVIAITGLLSAVGVVIAQVAALRRDLNGRLSQLLEETRERATKEGELRARDYISQQRRRSTDVERGTDVPLDS